MLSSLPITSFSAEKTCAPTIWLSAAMHDARRTTQDAQRTAHDARCIQAIWFTPRGELERSARRLPTMSRAARPPKAPAACPSAWRRMYAMARRRPRSRLNVASLMRASSLASSSRDRASVPPHRRASSLRVRQAVYGRGGSSVNGLRRRRRRRRTRPTLVAAGGGAICSAKRPK